MYISPGSLKLFIPPTLDRSKIIIPITIIKKPMAIKVLAIFSNPGKISLLVYIKTSQKSLPLNL